MSNGETLDGLIAEMRAEAARCSPHGSISPSDVRAWADRLTALRTPVETGNEAYQAGLPLPTPRSDAEVIAAIRTELWDALRGREIGGDRTLVGMVKRLRADRDETRDNRRGEFELRVLAEAELTALRTGGAHLEREALRKLMKESAAVLALAEPTLRDVIGHTNVAVFKLRIDEANELLSASPAPVPAPQEHVERRIREYLCFSHGHTGQYGDDGELQCGQCARFGQWDYRRAPLSVLLDTIDAVNMARLREALPPVPASHEEPNT